MTTVYLNGEYLPKARAMVSVEDRGFTFGDGIYEGVRAIVGKMFEWGAHEDRMTNGLAGLRINFGRAQVAELEAVCERLVRENGCADGEAFLYLEVTRGTAPRVHHFPGADTKPTVFVNATSFVAPRELREKGGKAVMFPDMRWARCDWKTVNLIGSVLARQAASEAGAYEAILHKNGVITEGAATNVFAVIDGTLRTHPLSHSILPGVTRKVVVALAQELGIPLVEEAIAESQIAGASEIFLCGSTTDVTPVVTLDGRAIGGGAPGPITVRLREALEARMYSPTAASRLISA